MPIIPPLLKVLAAFFGSLGIAVLFRVPPRRLVTAGLAGALAWAVFYEVEALGLGQFAAGFAGAAAAATGADYAARRLREPATLFVVPALLPLVPGARAYFAMLAFLQGDDLRGLELTINTFLVALSISAGLVAASSLLRIRYRKRPTEDRTSGAC